LPSYLYEHDNKYRLLSFLAVGNAESQSMEVVNRVRADYEKKLGELHVELRKLEVAKMEHAKMLKSQAQFEKQFRDAQRDLSEMKKQKVFCECGFSNEFIYYIYDFSCYCWFHHHLLDDWQLTKCA
jgi:hypothetical protein